MRLPFTLFLAAIAISSCVSAPAPAESELSQTVQSVQLACGDPRGCPDLIASELWMRAGLLLDNRSFAPSSCAVHEGVAQPGARRLLRMSSGFANIGVGKLVVGAPSEHPELFEHDECHGHTHFLEFTFFRLWRPDDYTQWSALRAAQPSAPPEEILSQNPELAGRMVAGGKRNFCIAEYFHCEPAFGCPEGQVVEPSSHPLLDPLVCDTNQGLSVGWLDIYPVWTDGQWIEAPPQGGTFILEHEVNPTRLFAESDYSNNSTAICVNIPPKNGRPFEPDPSCVTPPEFDEVSDCTMCLLMCEGQAGAIQNECPCAAFFCAEQ